jgi:3D (Asp-Asp-Asp) domain-containing protein
MKKLIFGNSATIVSALISTSLIFFSNSSIVTAPAHPIQEPQEQTKQATQILPTKEEVNLEAKTNSNLNEDKAEKLPTETPANESTTSDTANSIKASPEPVTTNTAAPEESGPVSPTQNFVATAYCLRGRTASGKYTTKGLIAADLKVLPIGTRVRIDAGKYSGEYLVADSGGAVRGKKIDIWVPSTREAMQFGRRTIKLTVLSYGGKRKKRVVTPKKTTVSTER